MEQPGLPLPPKGLLRAAGWSAALLLILALLGVLTFLATLLQVVVVPVLIATLGMALLYPLCRLLQRLHLPAWLAAALTTAVLAFSILVAGYVIVTALTEHGPDIAEGAQDAAGQLAEQFGLPGDLLGQAVDALRQAGEAMSGQIAQGLVTGVTLTVQIVIGGLLALVLTFFLLRDGHRLPGLLRGAAPAPYGEQLENLGRIGFRAMSGFMRGITLVSLIDAVLILIGLFVLGVPGAIGLAVLIFIGGYVPFVGALLSGAVAVLVAFADRGPMIALWVLVLIVAVQQLEGNLLEPIVQSRTVKLHPALVLIAITAGGGLAGIVGVLVAVPLTAAVVAILREVRGQGGGQGEDSGEEDDDDRAPDGEQAAQKEG
ncbi:AI-2E family transporter [Streptomyces sp. ACA25]|uniref:AI-2E family transporter n=1 Tax=Streptomyces sp. ACA25 TaxID=3022596 RepID=UPI0023070F42|nr:AI-2E family transporter [Streptomyces sp. ACA25]MDB1088682.1 AI-2E family transporter [Streptomyces sp. ACA25]